jgi:hypothetical protein
MHLLHGSVTVICGCAGLCGIEGGNVCISMYMCLLNDGVWSCVVMHGCAWAFTYAHAYVCIASVCRVMRRCVQVCMHQYMCACIIYAFRIVWSCAGLYVAMHGRICVCIPDISMWSCVESCTGMHAYPCLSLHHICVRGCAWLCGIVHGHAHMGMCMTFSNEYAGSCMAVHSCAQACAYGYAYAYVALGCTVTKLCRGMHAHARIGTPTLNMSCLT